MRRAQLQPPPPPPPPAASLGKFWSAFASEVGSFLLPGPKTTTTTTTYGSRSVGSITTATTRVPVPVMTTTVERTITRTSFVTVHRTTAVDASSGTRCAGLETCKESTTTGDTQASSTEIPISTTSSTRTTTSGIGSRKTENRSISAPSASSTQTTSKDTTPNHKHAIIGGLSGAIAGLVLIGALIIFFLRRRRKRDSSTHEKPSAKPSLTRKWTPLTTPQPAFLPAPAISRTSSPSPSDGAVLRVSTDNWPRPFAHGQSYRESIGPGALQVTNPDPSTPSRRPSSESSTPSSSSWVKQPRSALAAILTANRARAATSSAGSDRAPSTHSVSTLPHPYAGGQEDPFLTPPDERDELPLPGPSPSPRRPTLTPARTWSQLSSALHPFLARTRSNAGASVRSTSTRFSSACSSAGDPFKLDRESGSGGGWQVYEGT